MAELTLKALNDLAARMQTTTSWLAEIPDTRCPTAYPAMASTKQKGKCEQPGKGPSMESLLFGAEHRLSNQLPRQNAARYWPRQLLLT